MQIGLVLGTRPISPLEFWIGVDEGRVIELDQVVYAVTDLGDKEVKFYGIIQEVQKFLEGPSMVYEDRLFREGACPANVAYVAKVSVTRVEPEFFVPPQPGDPVYLAEGEELERALYYDQMKVRIPAGLTRNGQIVYLNYHFLNGVEGAHVSISGMSGVATKTSYALFLLYSVLKKGSDIRKHGIIFNVKGKDLLWIDKRNKNLSPEDEDALRKMGFEPEPFSDVRFYVPPHKNDPYKPDCERYDDRVTPFYWSMLDFAENGLIRFMFAEEEEGKSQVPYVVEKIATQLHIRAQRSKSLGVLTDSYGREIDSLQKLEELLKEAIEESEKGNKDIYREWFGDSSLQTARAFLRRFSRASMHIGRFVRGTVSSPIDWESSKVSVIDISGLHHIAQMFVVGAVLKRLFEEKESRSTPEPKVFVVLDELNKYAPRDGWSPIKDVILDIAERGRSLGVILIGAQQTASEIEKRVLANSAIKVVGRLDSSEVLSKEYEFLMGNFRQRALLLKKGSMILHQPDIPTPLMVRFPKPPWATRREEVKEEISVPEEFGNF
ncbi:ATPase-like protein [Thermocrinis albus DSM 14484]|uniref:ATPase-like protein n=1 Tax=Thermocrinis albus (strain DSM 14484 / JCM 11386 / HI 11/12) TaxID=638303 RepID=D3SNZ2_THEAH|nr:ATP-binding protein [Thermocrinis albus]ADC88879.1 ATPase-like protein [Thermocrinis albus DSM 14484]